MNYAWISIFVFVSMLISSRETGVLVDLALVIAVMFSSYELEYLLGQPEYIATENENAKVERYLAVIRNRIVTMEQLMDELFQYSVIAADNDIKLEKISINGVLEESILGFYAILKAENIVPEI